MELAIRNLSCGYGKRRVVDSISLSINAGEVIGLLVLMVVVKLP